MQNQIYYLSSLESTVLETTRECEFLNEINFDTGKKGMVVKLFPPIIGQDFGLGGNDIEFVVLTNRHESYSISPIKQFPCFVFVCYLASGDSPIGMKKISKDDLTILAWGELYRTRDDAENILLINHLDHMPEVRVSLKGAKRSIF